MNSISKHMGISGYIFVIDFYFNLTVVREHILTEI